MYTASLLLNRPHDNVAVYYPQLFDLIANHSQICCSMQSSISSIHVGTIFQHPLHHLTVNASTFATMGQIAIMRQSTTIVRSQINFLRLVVVAVSRQITL